jgi:hypothetical protein
MQVVLLAKILRYDDVLGAARPAKIRVIVAHPGKTPDAAASEMAATFTAAGFAEVELVTQGRAPSKVEGAHVVYLMSGVETEAIAAACEKHRVLSFADDIASVEQGLVPIGIGLTSANRPEIIVHLPRLRAQGHELSAQLLRLSRVIQ